MLSGPDESPCHMLSDVRCYSLAFPSDHLLCCCCCEVMIPDTLGHSSRSPIYILLA